MTAHFGDRLVDAIRRKNAPCCVGLDPLLDRLPPSLSKEHEIARVVDGAALTEEANGAAAQAILRFGAGVIDVVAAHVPAVKLNIAFFERYGAPGWTVYQRLTQRAHDAGLIVIGDVKRADIGHTSLQYALAHLGGSQSGVATGKPGPAAPDAVTINPYFGVDGVQPFVDVARSTGSGLFVLVQTSNDSAAEVQGLELRDGSTVCQQVARLVHRWASADPLRGGDPLRVVDGLVGESGYSLVGAVVSPRDLPSTRLLRELMPHCLFLVPGFGAQGRTARETAECFKSGGDGAIVTASRSVIYAYQESASGERHGDDWPAAVEEACRDFVAQIRALFRP